MKTKNCESEEVNQNPAVRGDNKIFINDFDQDTANSVCAQILAIAERDSQTPCCLYIDSDGGDVSSLASILSVIDSVPNPIVTIALGKAYSCGAILLSAGDVRCCGTHSRVLVHEVSGGTWGNVNDAEVDISEVVKLNQHFMELLAVNCGKTYKELKALFAKQRDIYLGPQEALKFGIIDNIGVPLVAPAVVHQLRFEQRGGKKKGKNKP